MMKPIKAHAQTNREFGTPEDQRASRLTKDGGDVRHAELHACRDAGVFRVREIVADARASVLPCMDRQRCGQS